jgi:nucleotide-binding universal stress UspA family protein
MTVSTIAVGVDASADARHAFEWAADLARALGAELVIVHAIGLLEHGRHDAHAWFEALDAPGVRLRRILRDGAPGPTLQAIARETGVDLLVVGSRGIGGAPIRLLGSTSTQVVQEATVPVVVVPR